MPCRKLTDADVRWSEHIDRVALYNYTCRGFVSGYFPTMSGCAVARSVLDLPEGITLNQFKASPDYRRLKDEILAVLQERCDSVYAALDVPVSVPPREAWGTCYNHEGRIDRAFSTKEKAEEDIAKHSPAGLPCGYIVRCTLDPQD